MKEKQRVFCLAVFLLIAISACGEKGKVETAAEGQREKNGHKDDHKDEKGREAEDKKEKSKTGEHAEREKALKLSPEALKNAGIKTAPARTQPVADTLAVTATISHNQDRLFHVTPRITGRVVDIRVSVGSDVKAGSVLAVLDSTELGQTKSEYIKTQTLLELAKANYEREKSLFDQKIAAKKDMLAAEAEYRKAEAEARTLHERLRLYGLSDQAINNLNNLPSQYSLISPGAGVVIERELSQGEVVETGKKVFTISDLSTVWVVLNLYEKDLAKVQKGTAVKIRTESYPGETFPGKVIYIGAILDPQSRTVPLRVEVLNPQARLKPGMFATAEIITGTSSVSALMIPLSAIQKIEAKTALFVQEKDGSFTKRDVELGREFGDSVEVKSGLKEGEAVVVAGAFTLKSEFLKSSLKGHAD